MATRGSKSAKFSSFLSQAEYSLCVVDAAPPYTTWPPSGSSPRPTLFLGETVTAVLVVSSTDVSEFARRFFHAAHIRLELKHTDLQTADLQAADLQTADLQTADPQAADLQTTRGSSGRWLELEPLPTFASDAHREPQVSFIEPAGPILCTMDVPVRALPPGGAVEVVCTVTPPLMVETGLDELLSSVPFAAEPDAATASVVLEVLHPLRVAARSVPLSSSHVLCVALRNTAETPVELVRASFSLAGASSVRDLAVRDGFHLESEGASQFPTVLAAGEELTLVYKATPKSPLTRSEAAFFADLRVAWAVDGGSTVTSAYRIPWRTPVSGDLIVQTHIPADLSVARVFPIWLQVTNASSSAKKVTLLLPAARGGLASSAAAASVTQATLKQFLDANTRDGLVVLPVALGTGDSPESDDAPAVLESLASEYLALHPRATALLCLEQSVVLGDIPPKATVSVNVYAVALSDGVFELDGIRLYDESAAVYFEVTSCPSLYVGP